MDLITKNHENLSIYPLLKTQQQNITTPQVQSIMHSSNSDFPIAIALLAIMAVALLLASYYIFVIKCCLNWQNLDPLRRFSISRARQNDEDQLISFSPRVGIHRGLDEWLINNIPVFQYRSGENNNNYNNRSRSISSSSISMSNSFRGCAVCLNGFKEQEILRNLPKCGHHFHLDCIDVWLLKNASCPLCRSSISGRTKYPIDHIIAPSSSPQDMLSPLFSGNLSFNINENEQDFLVIELSQEQTPRNVSEQKGIHQNGKKSRKFHRLSMMGDECINIRRKDEQFTVQQPIRRSISMDSAVDRGLYLQVQEILRQNNEIVSNNNEVISSSSNNVGDECNSSNGRVRRSSFFSFGHGRGSRTSSSILPL